MLILTISTVLFPYMAMNTSWQFVFISRVLTGCGNGLIVPAMNAMITKWIPNKEKSMAASIFTSGNQIAGIFGLPLAAAFCASEWKWPTVFYCGAIMGAIWLVIWRTTVKNSPQKSPYITEKELAYLERSIGDYKPKKKDFHTPWRHIFTSIPVFCCISSGLAVMMVTNGFYSAAPFIAQLIIKLSWSVMLDKLKGKCLSNTAAVKLSQGIATLMIVVSLILLGYLPDCQKPWIAVLLCCGVSGGFGIAINGFYVSMLSLAPAYTGILSSIHMIIGFIGMIATPQIVSYFRVYGILEEWRIIFFIIAGILSVTGIIFVLFGEAEVQPWARLDLMNGKNQHNLLNVKENDSPIIQVKDKANSILIH
uniref:Major facilitator superfamily (MFS) profile domain-containing protein n=1 Tax=Acrobeloides nanus TaxID=290746 RepID=A0A914CX01_9BILA